MGRFIRRIHCGLAVFVLIAACSRPAGAALALQEKFANYADGNLVGQFGWVAFGPFPDPPLQVAGGQVVVPFRFAPAGMFNDGESASKSLGMTFTPPASGTTSIFLGASITMDTVDATAGDNGRGISFVDGSGFNVLRLQSRVGTAPGTFQFGARMTGSINTPAVFGADLPLGPHLLVMRLDMVAGASNDLGTLYVDPPGPTPPSPYLIAPSSLTLPPDPPSITAVSINQFTPGSQNGYRIGFMNVAAGNGANANSDFAAVVPEPSASLLAVGVVCAIPMLTVRRGRF